MEHEITISLAAARVNAGMTQAQVATALHVGKQTIGNWETGKVIPNYPALKALSDLYRVPMDSIRLPSKSTES